MTAAPTANGRHWQAAGQRGVTYLVVLFLVALVGLGLAALGNFWSAEAQRQRERELLFIGEQFGAALWRYYDASPGAKVYPQRLEELLDDRRQQAVRRHLRQIFIDPLTGKRDWVVETSAGQIVAVHSRSSGVPLTRHGFARGWEGLADAGTHSEWVFRARQPALEAGGILPLAPAPVDTPTTAKASASSSNARSSPEAENSANSSDSSDNNTSSNTSKEPTACDTQRTADYATCQAGAAADPTGANASRRQQCMVSAALRYGDCLHSGNSSRTLLVP